MSNVIESLKEQLAAAREEIARYEKAREGFARYQKEAAQRRHIDDINKLAAADQNLKTMLQAAGEEAERQLAEKDKRIEALETELALAVVPDDHEAEERAVLQAELAAEKARADKAEERVRELVAILQTLKQRGFTTATWDLVEAAIKRVSDLEELIVSKRTNVRALAKEAEAIFLARQEQKDGGR